MEADVCPICGQRTSAYRLIATPGCPDVGQHRCHERTLRGIDAAGGVEDRKPRAPGFNKRLTEGFKMLDGESQ